MMRCHLFKGERVQCDLPFSSAYAQSQADGQSLWLDIESPTEDEFSILEDVLRFHKLSVEDCRHPQRRSKMERYATHSFLVLNALDQTTVDDPLDLVPICIFVRAKLVVTVRPGKVSAMDEVLNRATEDPERALCSSDRLLHAIVDAVVDEFLPLLDKYEEVLANIQDEVGKSNAIADRLVGIRRDLLLVRRIILPYVEVVRRLADTENPEITAEMRLYYRDVLDHVMIVQDTDNLLLEIVNGHLQLHANVVNERLNEVMKFLTIISALMLPWTVISGIFGMNFDVIPITHEAAGFYIAVGAMLVSGLALLAFFRRRGWF